MNEHVEAADEKSLTKIFTDPRLGAAIVDRLAFGGNIIRTGTEFHRLARAQSPPG
ncbi:UNVERIFIED_CONTAM: hypothetical protein RKD43_006136 [Streptomyces graminofaciens]